MAMAAARLHLFLVLPCSSKTNLNNTQERLGFFNLLMAFKELAPHQLVNQRSSAAATA